MQQSAPPELFETILYEKRKATAYVTLNRPKVMNALNRKAISELHAAFEDARDDSQVRGIIISLPTFWLRCFPARIQAPRRGGKSRVAPRRSSRCRRADRLVPEVVLQPPRVVARLGERKAARMAQHARHASSGSGTRGDGSSSSTGSLA
jgi:hypothetical protein